MNSKKTMLILACSALCIMGCESKAGTGALVGAGGGAVVGAAVGGAPGAAIGAGAGAVGGAIVGAILDSQDRHHVEQQNPRTLDRIDNGEQLTVHDIISLHKSGIGDDKIIELIDKTGSHYHLNTYQINRLENAGVSQRVINYMMNT